MKLVFDIESNGLLDTVDTIWIIVAVDLTTNTKYVFSDYPAKDKGAKPLKEFRKLFDQATLLIGHNIIGYDLPLLRKLENWFPKDDIKIVDTMIMSQVLNYNRFGGKHNLALWGKYVGKEKPEHNDWSKYSDEMLHRCLEDVDINVLVYKHLIGEFKVLSEKKPLIKESLRVEHDVAHFCSLSREKGWLFNKQEALVILDKMKQELKAIEDEIEPKLRLVIKPLDKEPKEPKWIKNGNYDAFTARYFGLDPSNGRDIRTVQGPYSRIEIIKPDLGSIESVKAYLYTIGWEPDDWNWEKINGDFVKKSPKLTTSSLEKLGNEGLLLDKYYTTRSRHDILSGWIENLDVDGRLHGDCFTIATPTSRARHSGIVNVPSAKAEWGPEMRKLFIVEDGWTIVGADSSGNQFRALCHYLKNDEYTNEVINGDVHQKNADVLTSILREEKELKPDESLPRSTAKPFIYAYLFGAGGEKVSLILTGKRNAKLGNKIKGEFAKRVPGLAELNKKIQQVYYQTEAMGDPYIPALDGRRVPCESAHKGLNYLLQSAEAITCKAAVAMIMKKLNEEEIPWIPLIFYHDEVEFAVPDEYAEKAAELSKECFKEAPKVFGVTIMDGEAKLGKTWYDVH